MNVPRIIRISAVVIGLGAALLFTSSVKAQEIDNTVWAEGSNTAPLDQAGSTVMAPKLTPVAANSQVAVPNAKATPAAATQQASVLQQSVATGWLFPLTMVCIAVIAVPALMKSKRTTDTGGKNLKE